MSNVENVTVSEKDKRKRCENEDEGITFLKLRHVNKFQKNCILEEKKPLREKNYRTVIWIVSEKREKQFFFGKIKQLTGVKSVYKI